MGREGIAAALDAGVDSIEHGNGLDEGLMDRMVAHGVLALEMEASALYTIAAGHGRRALAICTVSDHLGTGEETTAQEREQTFGDMVRIALTAALAGGAPPASTLAPTPR